MANDHIADVEITLQAQLRLPADPADGTEPTNDDWKAEAREICQEDVLFHYADREPTNVRIIDVLE